MVAFQATMVEKRIAWSIRQTNLSQSLRERLAAAIEDVGDFCGELYVAGDRDVVVV